MIEPTWKDEKYGIELEPEYFDIAVKRIKQAIIDKQGGELFAAHIPDDDNKLF